MSAFKGTPGPWAVTESTECEYVMVVGANGSGLFCENVDHPGAREDARLIAAAPELLSCLEMTAHGLEVASRVVGGNLGVVFSDRAMSARAAIAKATGGDA